MAFSESKLKNFNFKVILRYCNINLDNNLYFQNLHKNTKISTSETLTEIEISAEILTKINFGCHYPQRMHYK